MLLDLLLLNEQVIDSIAAVLVRLRALVVLIDAVCGDRRGEVGMPEEVRGLAVRSLRLRGLMADSRTVGHGSHLLLQLLLIQAIH